MVPLLPPGGAEAPRVPGWLLECPVGAGGQGMVWRAVRDGDDEPGAVKIFHRGGAAADAEQAVRLENEATLLAKLEHPGIVRVLDAGRTDDGRFFIATAFIEGCDLARLMRADPLPAARALDTARQIAAALDHAHQQGVVHRDLKPANVMDAGSGRVLLLDFSLAAEMAARPLLSVTAGGTAPGTPYYMAPERIRRSAAGPAADVYALGVMLYEMLTGALPVGRFEKVSGKAAVPGAADALLNAMLAETPERRPSAAETAQRLESLGRALETTSAGRRWRRRWWLGAAACGIAGTAWAAGFAMRREPPAPPPVPALNARGFANPAAASREAPWINSQGMAFLPVPALPGRLFAKLETKMDDYRAFIASVTGPDAAEWEAAFGQAHDVKANLLILKPGGWVSSVPEQQREPGANFPELPGAAAWGLNWPMARRFCAWLTWREQREGRLGPGEHYRLPTDAEWSTAAGLPPEPGAMPKDRHENLPDGADRYPWGPSWPPPAGFANYAGKEARDENWPLVWLSLKLRKDGFPRVAPAGSFPAQAHGLHDLWGNVWEWCEDRASQVSSEYVLRGGSWVDGGYNVQLRRDFRNFRVPGYRDTSTGFRCVLVFSPP